MMFYTLLRKWIYLSFAFPVIKQEYQLLFIHPQRVCVADCILLEDLKEVKAAEVSEFHMDFVSFLFETEPVLLELCHSLFCFFQR